VVCLENQPYRCQRKPRENNAQEGEEAALASQLMHLSLEPRLLLAIARSRLVVDHDCTLTICREFATPAWSVRRAVERDGALSLA